MQIEVEKSFQPTPEQLEKLLYGAEFLGEKVLNDIYFDFADYSLHKQGVYLRTRNGKFELKIKKPSGEVKIEQEIDDVQEIKKYFNTDKNMEDFIKDDMIVFYEYVNNRKKYKKGDFIIDLDNLDFGYSLVEIELLVDDESLVDDAVEKIKDLAISCGIEIKETTSKRKMYIKTVKPELYETLFG